MNESAQACALLSACDYVEESGTRTVVRMYRPAAGNVEAMLLLPESTRSRTGERRLSLELPLLHQPSTLPAAAIIGAAEAIPTPELADSRTAAGVCRLRRADAGIAPAHV
jgi:hypothetical protein